MIMIVVKTIIIIIIKRFTVLLSVSIFHA